MSFLLADNGHKGFDYGGEFSVVEKLRILFQLSSIQLLKPLEAVGFREDVSIADLEFRQIQIDEVHHGLSN